MNFDYEYFKKAIFEMTKVDLNAYKDLRNLSII